MGVTISTHNGSKVAREHNIRNEKVIRKEPHIDPNGTHETWIDEPIRQAYDRIFGEAVAKYNAKQSRPERQIKSYYNDICKSSKKHPVYEMLVGIYGKDKNGNPICDPNSGKKILRKFVDTWSERNPNLIIIGAYYHADEQGEPHIHIDYIPVAHGYKKGLETQTGLVRALGDQGFHKSNQITAQIQWEKSENDYLTKLCENIGLTVEHPQIEGRKHLDTQTFKLQSRIEELEKTVKKKEQKLQETEVKYKVTLKELKNVIDKKSKASEIKRSIFDRETQSYHKNMLESTRAIGSDTYENMIKSKESLQQAELLMMKVEQKERSIDPLYKKALEDRNNARYLKEKEEEIINTKAKKIADKKISDAFTKAPDSRSKRLEAFCSEITFSDGSTALELFEEREKELRKHIEEFTREL